MKAGFIVSFIGSVSLGYVNLIALQLFALQGWAGLIPFALGVIFVEFWVIYFTFLGAKKLLANVKLLLWIDVFSFFFMLFLAFSFLQTNDSKQSALPTYLTTLPAFVIGILLNSINFMQFPFWAGWNIFLIEKQWIKTTHVYSYSIGAVGGTCAGMFAFVLLLHYFVVSFSGHLFFLIFITLACVPLWKVIKKTRARLRSVYLKS